MTQTALITGASSGIGFELAKIFAAEKYNLVLTARNQQALEQLSVELKTKHGIQTTVIPLDLSEPSAPAKLFEEVQKQNVVVDVLVNNAGFGTFGNFSETDLNEELQEMQLNMIAPVELTKRFLPRMLKAKSGKIMNVASTAAFQPGPLMAVYYATKAFLLHFTEALANELEGTGVTVTALCPGATVTGFQKRAHMEDSNLVRGRIMDSKTVAEAGYKGMMRGKVIIVPGLKNKLLRQSVRFGPRSLVTKIVRGLNQPHR